MRERRPYAVLIYKEGRRHFYGFARRSEAQAFRDRERVQHPGKVSAVITLGSQHGR